MCFVGSIVSLPNGVVLAFVIITVLGTYVTAGFVGFVFEFSATIGVIPTSTYEKEFAAVMASVWYIVLLNSVEKIIIEE